VVRHNLLVKPGSTGPQERLALSPGLEVIPEKGENDLIPSMDVEPWQP
jgi:hypothetical protein